MENARKSNLGSGSGRSRGIYPIVVWQKTFWSCLKLYREAPRQPSVSFGGFKGRVARSFRLHGQVTAETVERCLYDRPHAFGIGGVVYEIVQKSTGRRYIGITDSPEGRWKQHRLAADRPRAPLHVEMNKAGLADFEFRVIAEGGISRDALVRLERALIVAESTVWPSGLNAR